jgi:hypothetical protein
MNRYGQMAHDHTRQHRPDAYSQIPNPDEFFAEVGEDDRSRGEPAARSDPRPTPTRRGPRDLPAPELPGLGDRRGADPGGPSPVPDGTGDRDGRGLERRSGPGPPLPGPREDQPDDQRSAVEEQEAPARPAPFRPSTQDDLAPPGVAAKLQANLDVLAVLNRCRDDGGRWADAEEQSVLARWSGWGAIPQVFDDGDDRYANERAELRRLLRTEDGWARRVARL